MSEQFDELKSWVLALPYEPGQTARWAVWRQPCRESGMLPEKNV
ncbi:hypothetical protein [Intestinibacillus sp. Marseille-P6563]|nr:hypothetical protein [Intestinibacillus sp. Marseille-P6563]